MKFDHNVIRSLHENPDMSWTIVLTELIDNALDAGATEVAMLWHRGKEFRCADNGSGVSPAGFEAMYTLGGHTRSVNASTRSIGRYGVGFKEAAAWLWGETRVTSTHDGRKRQLVIDWEQQAALGETHETSAPIHALAGRPGAPYTRIDCRRTRRTMPNPDVFDRLVRQLSHTYRPALLGGFAVAFVRGPDPAVPLRATPWPTKDVDAPEVDGALVIDGRTVHVRAFVAREDLEYPGIHIAALGRVMDRLPTRVNSRRLYGWVTLGPEWQVGKNKTAITDPRRDELMAAVTTYCQAVLDAAERDAESIALTILQLSATSILRNGLAGTLLRPSLRAGKGSIVAVVEIPVTENPVERPTPKAIEREPSPNTSWHPDPDDLESDESTAPKLYIRLAPTPGDQLVVLDAGEQEWTVIINNKHEIVHDYLREPCFGARGSDPMRLTGVAVDALAAAAVTNDYVASAFPFLDGVPPNERYGIATSKLWADVLAHRGD
jgi:hypothetical protein